MLAPGDPFPSFSLPDQDGRIVSNSTLKGAKAVIYFYPKDDTPGCTVEACSFQAAGPSVPGARVVGVSPDSPESHRKFADKYGLEFTLLADSEHKLAEAAGVWKEKNMYGRRYMGIERTTFLVDENGKVLKVFEKVVPRGHAQEVARALA